MQLLKGLLKTFSFNKYRGNKQGIKRLPCIVTNLLLGKIKVS